MRKILWVLSILIVFTCKLYAQEGAGALEFIENKGQWQKDIRFKGVLTNGAFFLRKTGFTVVQHNPEDLAQLGESVHGHLTSTENTAVFEKTKVSGNLPVQEVKGESEVLHSHAYNVDFIGANTQAEVVPEKPQPTYDNYFIGDDPSKWKGNCKIYNAVTYKNVYPNIDIKYYSESGYLKYEFIIDYQQFILLQTFEEYSPVTRMLPDFHYPFSPRVQCAAPGTRRAKSGNAL